ncbi:MAG: acetyl-CoA carboxylase biotin carboxyl carrier protein [Rhodothalassiaceae bacterium]
MTKLTDTQEFITHLAELLKDSDLSEIEVESEDMRIRLARGTAVVAAPAAFAAAPAPGAAPASGAPAAATKKAEPPEDLSTHPGAVLSPMVGTAYAAPDPNSPPFVQEGEKVAEGQTLLIIEAMKVMNPIKAHRAGTVSRILFQNAQPVEFGEPLVLID